MHTGVDDGRLVPIGNDADLPPGRREEDARSARFEFAVPEETWMPGRPGVRSIPSARHGGHAFRAERHRPCVPARRGHHL
jgi:hypothetical protein